MEKNTRNECSHSFVPMPTNLIYLLDNDCFKIMAVLIQEESYWKSKDRLSPEGFFFKSIDELTQQLNYGNAKDVRLTLEALFRASLVDIKATDGVRHTAAMRINWNTIKEISEKTITDIIKFENRICKLKRTEQITYADKMTTKVRTKVETDCASKLDTELNTNCRTDCHTNLSTNCTPTIDNIDKIENQDNLDKSNKIDKRKYLVNNIISDSSNSFDRSKNEEAKPIDDSSISSIERKFDNKEAAPLYPTAQAEEAESKPQPQIPSYNDIPFGDTETLKRFYDKCIDLIAQSAYNLVEIPDKKALFSEAIQAYKEVNPQVAEATAVSRLKGLFSTYSLKYYHETHPEVS